jgi:uncharacterized protein (TIGR03435 family)
MAKANWLRALSLAVAVLSAIWAFTWPETSPRLSAQQAFSRASIPDWQLAAGGQMAFDSASVQQNTSASPGGVFFNFPLGPGDVYIPNGGNFRARNLPLVNYILFAYKLTENQQPFLLSQLPAWVITDRFDIQAKAQGTPTKDQMRLMMQALLADRFKLAAHFEVRQVPVFALLVDQPGHLGPLLQKHPEDSPCPTTPFVPSPAPTAPPVAIDGRFPLTCGGLLGMNPSAPGRVRAGARNVPMELIASSLTGRASGFDLPIVDETELTGGFDFAMEFVPEEPPSAGANSQPGSTGPTFAEALKNQLGLKLESQTSPVNLLVIDFIDQLPPN